MKQIVFLFALLPIFCFGQSIVTAEMKQWMYGGAFNWDECDLIYVDTLQPFNLADCTNEYEVKGDTLIVTKTCQEMVYWNCLVFGCNEDHRPPPTITKHYYLIEHLFDEKGVMKERTKVVKELVFERQ